MSMDGLYRPSQHLGYLDTLGHLNAADRAKAEAARQNKVLAADAIEAVDNEDDILEEKKREEQKNPQENPFHDELQDLIAAEFNIAFDPNILYRFVYNDQTDRFELVDTFNQTVLLSLTPEAFLKVTANAQRNSGVMTDHCA